MLKKLHLILLMPFFAFLSFFLVACTPESGNENADTNVYPVSCRFESNTPVVLSSNDKNNEETVKLIVEGSNITVAPQISYNTEIISYDIETGVITAISQGQTSIVVLYQTSQTVYKQIYLNVSVVDAVFANRVVLESSYLFKLYDNVKTAQIVPNSITRSGDYSHEYIFESLSPAIFEVDENGYVLPINTGTGLIKVSAVSGFDFRTNAYTYVSATAQIVVELPIQSFSLDVVDQNLNSLTSLEAENKIYNLYYGTKFGETDENKYYFKIECSKFLNECIIREIFEGTNNVQTGVALHSVLGGGESGDDATVIYIPFAVRDAGFETVTYINLDVGLNYSNNVYSNSVSFYPIPYMTNLEVSCVSYAGEENVIENLYTVEPNTTTGNYTLYLLEGTDEDKILGQSAGYASYVNISFSNINVYALNKLTIEHESGVVTDFSVLEHIYTVRANNVGQTQVTLIANDESGWNKTLTFDVVYLNPTSYELANFDNDLISLVCGIESLSSVNLDLVSYSPSYASVNLRLSFVVLSGSNPISVNGTTISANSKGECYVVLQLNGESIKTYTVEIYNKPTKLVFETPTNLSIEPLTPYEMIFSLQDDEGNEISIVELKAVIIDESGNETHEFDEIVYVDFTTEGAILQVLEQGTYKIRIETTVGDEIFKEITVLCT